MHLIPILAALSKMVLVGRLAVNAMSHRHPGDIEEGDLERTQIPFAGSPPFHYPEDITIEYDTTIDGEYMQTSRSAVARSDITGHMVTLRTSQSVHPDLGSFSSQDLLYDRYLVFQMTFRITNEGAYMANVTWGDLVKGGSNANYTINPNGIIKGSFDGRPFRPFFAINASRSTFDDGESFPVLSVSDIVNMTIFDTVPRLTSNTKRCRTVVPGKGVEAPRSLGINTATCLTYWNLPAMLLPCAATNVALFGFRVAGCYGLGSCP